MNTRIALIGIIVESNESVSELNRLLSEYSQYIIGRMGIPYREKNISIISVAIDAPNDIISSLSTHRMILSVHFRENSECFRASTQRQLTQKHRFKGHL